MLNTTDEDQQVARQLSGWKPQTGAHLPDFTSLEPVVRARAELLQGVLFASATGFTTPSWNINPQVREVVMATLILHFPEMQHHRSKSPYVLRVCEALGAVNIQVSELLAWSLTIRAAFEPASEDKEVMPGESATTLNGALAKLSRQLEEVLVRQARMEERHTALESTSSLSTARSLEKQDQHARILPVEVSEEPRPKRARKRASKSLSTAWFEWFTAVPRIYESTSISKANLHESKYAVAYMMLCLPRGFRLVPESPAYKAEVHALGAEAEKMTLEFLASRGSQAVAVGSVVKAMRVMQKAGDLGDLLQQYRINWIAGNVVDPTPTTALPPFLRLT